MRQYCYFFFQGSSKFLFFTKELLIAPLLCCASRTHRFDFFLEEIWWPTYQHMVRTQLKAQEHHLNITMNQLTSSHNVAVFQDIISFDSRKILVRHEKLFLCDGSLRFKRATQPRAEPNGDFNFHLSDMIL